MHVCWRHALGLAMVINGAACTDVVVDPPTDGGAPGTGGFGQPGTGGAANDGGAPATGGSPSSGGGGEGAGGGGAGPTCLADLELPSGMPVEIASGLDTPKSLVLVGDDIYLTDSGHDQADGALVRVPKLGGPLELVVLGQSQAETIAADTEHVYWLNRGTGNNGSLNRLSLADDSSDILVADLQFPFGVAAHDGSVFATELDHDRVYAVGPDLEVEIVSNDYSGFAIAVDSTGIYLGASDNLTFSGVGHIDDQGNTSLLYDAQYPVITLLLDGNDLYFSTAGFSVLKRGTRDGAPAITLAEPEQLDVISSTALADCFVYFTTSERVARVPVDGGEVQVIAEGQGYPMGIGVDDEAIYWISNTDRTVMRLAK